MKELIGQTVLVFDCDSWRKTGDIGDNSQFWKPAIVIAERLSEEIKMPDMHLRGGEELVDVQFEDGRISKGHFKSGVQIISQMD